MSVLRRTKEFISSSDATTATEYAIMLSLVIVVGLLAFRSLGGNLSDVFSTAAGDTFILHNEVVDG